MSQSHSRNSRRQSKIVHHSRKHTFSKPLLDEEIVEKGLLTIRASAFE